MLFNRKLLCLFVCVVLTGCGANKKNFTLDSGYQRGEYTITSIEAEFAPDAIKGTASEEGGEIALPIINQQLQQIVGQKEQGLPEVTAKVVIDDYVDNISTAQLMLSGGSYLIESNVYLYDSQNKQVGKFEVLAASEYNSGGLLGIAIEGMSSEEARRKELIDAFVGQVISTVYNKI
jgi:hypothetical protein